MPSPKIVCVGMIKTGTLSLHNALRCLGVDSIHNPAMSRRITENALQGKLDPWYLKHQAFSDGPLWRAALHLHDLDPDALFIITRRDRESWINSRIVHALYNRMIRYAGAQAINPRAWNIEYDQALQIHEELKTRPRVLEMEITRGDGWEKLCPFISVPIPDHVVFPRDNGSAHKLQQILDRYRNRDARRTTAG